MTTLYLRLPVVVDDADPMRCSAECPHYFNPCDHAPSDLEVEDQPFCLLPVGRELDWSEDDSGWMRTTDCIRATNAAIDAEIEALREGFGMAAREAYTEVVDIGSSAAVSPRIHWDIATEVLDAYVARLEARKVKP